MVNNGIKIYQPENQLKIGYFSVWQDMFMELKNSRELVWRLFIRDFLSKYKQSVFGILWAIIMPLVFVSMFFFLNRAGVLNIGEVGVPYPIFAILSLSIWQIFATGLTVCSNSIVSGGSMVVKINFPKESLVIASMGQSIVEFLIRILLLLIIFAYYQYIPMWTVIFLPLALLPLVFLTLGLGFLFALLNAVMRDVANIVTLATTFLLFLTPVLYPMPSSHLFALFNAYNPLSYLITGARDVVITGYLTQPAGFLLVSVFSFFVFLASWRIFHLVEPRIAERV